MARHQTSVLKLPTQQGSSFNNVQQTVHDTRSRDDQGMERRKEELIALPPVRATTSSDHQSSDHLPENRQLTALTKWQIQRCSSPNPGYCQEELVNDWLHRNHIRVVQRLPKMDPFVLTSRGTDVSKYISFIRPPPLSFKVFSTEDRRSRENTHRRAQNVSPESTSPCPRLLRSQRSDREMFPLNPVIRVGGGYRRLSWKVLDVLPSIGQYVPDFSPCYWCASCNASLPVTEKVINSRGQLRTILATPKQCHKCGTPTTDYQALTEKDLHESVLDTLHRGDSRYIVDHRRFYKSRDSRASPKYNKRISPSSSSPLDWHDDMESFRLHMSRQSYQDDDLETRDQASEHKRSESRSSVFMTEPGVDIDKINEPPDVRRAWDDGSARAEVTREYEDESGDWGKGEVIGSGLSDNDNDSFSDFEIIEDYDPESGLTVRLRRRPFGGTQKTSYLIHGIQDDESAKKNSISKGRKHGYRNEKTLHRKQETGPLKKKTDKQIFAEKKAGRQSRSHDIYGNEEEPDNVKQKENKTNKREKNYRHSLPRTDSFYTVGLDRRDYVFSEEPVIEDTEEDDVIIDPGTRLTDESLSDIDFNADSWSSGPLLHGAVRRPSMPSPNDQEYADYSSSLSISPTQHDGYLADSEENADLSSLQAQIQQARNDAKKNQKRKEEVQEVRRKESKSRKEKATEGSVSQKPTDVNGSDRAFLNNGEWDDDWDSDFSLHVQPLSDLSMSSSEDDPWENGTQRRSSNLEPQKTIKQVADKTTSNVRRKASKPGDIDRQKNTLDGEGRRRSSATETRVRDRKSSRHTTVKPIPTIGPGSDSDNALPRPKLRAPKDEDDLSESDLSYFKQQFQAPYLRKGDKNGTSSEVSVGCKGIDCYRCGALIPECQGICGKCGTMCQRPGGPCSACRDICESCGNPRYKCTSACKRLDANVDGEGEEEHIASDDLEAKPAVPKESKNTSRGEDRRPVRFSSADDIGVDQEHSPQMVSDELNVADQNFEKKKERKSRAPTERKRKDVNNIKRVRTKRNQISLNEDEEHEFENKLENEVDDEHDELKDVKIETHRESVDRIPVEDLPSKPEPSAYSDKSTKKAKPSKKVISQTVVYKEKDKPPTKEQKSPKEEDSTQKNDSGMTSPTLASETVEAGEEVLPRLEEQGVKDESVVSKNDIRDDDKTKSEKEGKNGNEKKIEKEKEEKEQKQEQKEKEQKKNVVPKVRGVMRVNAAFRERAELAKRLQSVLKEAISDVIGQADAKTRKDSTIDYLSQYRLVNRSHLEMYGRAFTLEDDDEDGIISYEQMLLALEGVPSIAGMSRKQLLFVLQVLELFPGSRITFKMFSVTTALCEKVTVLDEFVKQLVEELDLFDLECKLDMFRSMFFVTGDYSVNFITADQLRIELKAGGLNQQQEDHVIGHVLRSTQPGEISFLDYMAYLPLFLSIHQNICDNALDMSRNKYQRSNTT